MTRVPEGAGEMVCIQELIQTERFKSKITKCPFWHSVNTKPAFSHPGPKRSTDLCLFRHWFHVSTTSKSCWDYPLIKASAQQKQTTKRGNIYLTWTNQFIILLINNKRKKRCCTKLCLPHFLPGFSIWAFSTREDLCENDLNIAVGHFQMKTAFWDSSTWPKLIFQWAQREQQHCAVPHYVSTPLWLQTNPFWRPQCQHKQNLSHLSE